MMQIIKNLIFILFIIFLISPLYADTIFLKDGSLISGKVIEKANVYYLFSNTYGTFEVKKKNIKRLIITKAYTTDILIYKKLRKKFDAEKIKDDVEAGMEELKKTSERKLEETNIQVRSKSGHWDYGRLSFSMAYFTTINTVAGSLYNINSVLPGGIGANLSYDQGLEFRHKHFMIPGIKVEHSYIYFSKKIFVNETKKVNGHAAYAGLMWAFPGLYSNWGCITLSGLPGASFMFINNKLSEKSENTISFSFKTSLGYEYQIKFFAIQIHLNYNFIIDQTVAFHGIGVSLGFAFKLW